MNIKIPFSFKIYVFLVNLLFLIWFIIIVDSIINILFFIDFIFLLIFNYFVYQIYKYKNWAINIFMFILILHICYIFYLPFFWFNSSNLELVNIFFFIFAYTVFPIWVLVKLFIFKRNIKIWIDKVNKRYITNKKQWWLFLKIQAWIILFLLIFRFTYYDFPKDIEEIDDSYFITKYENTDIADEENMYFFFKEFNFEASPTEHESRYIKEDIVECLYKDNCYPWEFYEAKLEKLNWKEIVDNNKYQFLTDKVEILSVKIKLKNTDILYTFEDISYMEGIINDLSKRSYFKYPYSYDDLETLNKDYVSYTWIIQYYRELRYQILYYLENDQEDKAIELVNNMLKIWNTIMSWDSEVINKLVGIKLLRIIYEHLDILIDNTTFTSKNKVIIRETLSKDIEKSYLDNGLKNQYKYVKLWAMAFHNWVYEIWFNYDYSNKTTLFKLDEVIKMKKVYYYNIIENPHDDIERLQINYFKSNIIWYILHNWLITTYSSQYKKLEDLEQKRQELVEKLEKN